MGPTKEEAPLCNICCEKINKSSRKLVTCPFCNVETCMYCVKRYLLDLLGDPHCMHCRVGWNNDFMRSTFPSTWISKEYKVHREQILFDIEKARMPETQEHLEITKQRNNVVKLTKDLEKRYKELRTEYLDAMALYRDQRYLLSRIDRYINGNGPNPFLQRADGGSSSSAQEEKQKKQFIMPCPINDCRGFLSTAWKCGVCERNICKDCHCEKEDGNDHICDENIRSSIATMKRDSKPCPSCGSMIFRISGCDQMWCTQCCTAFSWNTGRIHTGTVHNPHYFNWLQQNGQDTRRVTQNPCGRRYAEGYNPPRNFPQKMMNAYRMIRHIIYVELPRFRAAPGVDPNRDLRISYMLGIMTDKEFKSILQKREKNEAKKAQIRGILNMFVDVSDDILRHHGEQNDPTRNYAEEMDRIKDYTNKCFHSVAKQYQSQQAYLIHKNFDHIRLYNITSDIYRNTIDSENTGEHAGGHAVPL